jgi:hypothetical protein
MEDFDIKLFEKMKKEIKEQEILILRFVDDFDTITVDPEKSSKLDQAFDEVSEVMKLKLTEEKENEEDGLQFLDIKQTTRGGLCMEYAQRTDKPLVPFKSNHSKNVFEGIIIGAIKNALAKSCPCKNKEALIKQEKRFIKHGYPKHLIEKIKRKILSKKPKRKWEIKRVGTAPQLHKLTHNMRRTARDYNLQITSTYKPKFSTLPGRCDRMANKQDKECKNHKEKAFECKDNSIYEIVLSCGSIYDGESGRCVNTRFAEHIEGKGTTNTIKDHMKKCKCEVVKDQCRILYDKNLNGWQSRRVVEAMFMDSRVKEIGQQKVLSAPSIIPTEREVDFILKHCQIPFP